jgi:hypothetical protein
VLKFRVENLSKNFLGLVLGFSGWGFLERLLIRLFSKKQALQGEMNIQGHTFDTKALYTEAKKLVQVPSGT